MGASARNANCDEAVMPYAINGVLPACGCCRLPYALIGAIGGEIIASKEARHSGSKPCQIGYTPAFVVVRRPYRECRSHDAAESCGHEARGNGSCPGNSREHRGKPPCSASSQPLAHFVQRGSPCQSHAVRLSHNQAQCRGILGSPVMRSQQKVSLASQRGASSYIRSYVERTKGSSSRRAWMPR